jgi:outer membrane lipoprotein-sorting protein
MRPTLRRTPVLGQVLAAALLLSQVAAAAEGGLRTPPAVKVNQPGLTARQIVEKAREAAKRNGKGNAVFTFLRKARIEDLDSKGNIRKGYTKTYRAYTDGRDQELLSVDGKPASRRQIAREQARNRKQQRRYLARKTENGANRSENLVTKNADLFWEKFTPVLAGVESVNARPAYVIQLQPNTDHKLGSRTVNRFMNQFDARVWVDKEEFHIARIDAKLKKPVTFLGGLAGAVNAVNISVSQKRLASDTWVDESLSANFDARVFWKTYRFRMKSQSSHFKSATALGDNNRTKPLEEMTP